MAAEILILAQYIALAQCLQFRFDAIPPPPRFDFRPAAFLRLEHERVRGKIRGRHAQIALAAHNGHTALHEAGHYLLRIRDGDADGEHVRDRAWACVPEAVAAPAFGDVTAAPWYGGHR